MPLRFLPTPLGPHVPARLGVARRQATVAIGEVEVNAWKRVYRPPESGDPEQEVSPGEVVPELPNGMAGWETI